MDIGHPKDVASTQSSSSISSLYSDSPHRSPSLERMSLLSNQVPTAAFPLSYSQVNVPYGDDINTYNCQSLTRHAWVPEDNDLIIREIESALRYGPEYYGPPYNINGQLALCSNQHYTLTSSFGFNSHPPNMEPQVYYHMPQMVPPPHTIHSHRPPMYHYPRHDPYPNSIHNTSLQPVLPSRQILPPPSSPRENSRGSSAELNRDQKKTLPGQHMATRIFKKNQEQAYRKRKSKKRVRSESKLKNEVKF